jgi:hypothetical protein
MAALQTLLFLSATIISPHLIAPGHRDYNAAAPPAQSSDVRIPVMIGIDEADAWTTASTSCRSETVFLMDVFLMDRVFFLATDAPPSPSRTSQAKHETNAGGACA